MTVPVVNIAIRTRAEDDSHKCVFSTVILKYNIPLSEQVTSSNVKYVVKWNFDLNGRILTVPENCIFEFDGGKISNGSIVWNNTKVLNLYNYTILENVTEQGTRKTLGGDI